jgi:hypothetical protein
MKLPLRSISVRLALKTQPGCCSVVIHIAKRSLQTFDRYQQKSEFLCELQKSLLLRDELQMADTWYLHKVRLPLFCARRVCAVAGHGCTHLRQAVVGGPKSFC